MIPGCVGRGVRLGSENSSGAGGGVWKSGNLETWGPGNPESWGPKNQKLSKFKSVLPKMSTRSGLVGKTSSRPYLGPFEAIFSIGRKNPKNAKMLPIFPLFTRFGPLLLSTRGGGIGSYFVFLDSVGFPDFPDVSKMLVSAVLDQQPKYH